MSRSQLAAVTIVFSLEGDGIFALQFLPKNTLACFFSGFKVKENYVEELWVEKVGGMENFLNLKQEDSLCQEFIERKSYLIALDHEHDLDIPPDIAVDSDRFRATSGHKTNHWFAPNCFFGWALHPIHGRSPGISVSPGQITNIFPYRIRSLVTLRDVKEGEELTVDYDYQVDNKFTPEWYSKLYQVFYRL